MLFEGILLVIGIIFIFAIFSENSNLHKEIVNNQKFVREAIEAQHRRMSDIEKAASKTVERVSRLEKSLNALSNKLDDSMIAIGDLRSSLKVKKSPVKK